MASVWEPPYSAMFIQRCRLDRSEVFARGQEKGT
jgi:hypothetical protein